jgi:hypothetical protein
MQKLIQYRGKESICRQRAVFDVENRWRWLAEADMWAHKVQDGRLSRSRPSPPSDQADVAKMKLGNPKAAA